MEKRNISISSKNGYTYEKVMRAKKYLEEIGSNKRTFPFETLVAYYNDLLGTHELATGCKCQSPKYFNGISNYFKYGKLTLINNGLATEEDFEIKEETPEEIAPNRINLGNEASVNGNSLEAQNEASESVSEDKVDDVKEEENKASDEAKNEPTEKKKVGRPKKNV